MCTLTVGKSQNWPGLSILSPAMMETRALCPLVPFMGRLQASTPEYRPHSVSPTPPQAYLTVPSVSQNSDEMGVLQDSPVALASLQCGHHLGASKEPGGDGREGSFQHNEAGGD